MNANIVLIKIFLFLLLLSFSNELTDKYNRGTYNVICANKDTGCKFEISANYPMSPKIPTSFPGDSILSDYRYIYILFNVVKSQNLKTFYLEAYDSSSGETIISDGDCYLIDLAKNTKYELRIFKVLKTKSFIQFSFFGLPKICILQVTLLFNLDIGLYFSDIYLEKSNSLYKNKQQTYVKYLEEYYNNHLIYQKNRKKMCQETIKKIGNNFFGTMLDINLSTLFGSNDFINSIKIPALPFLITISYSVGLEMSSENIFQPESNILSETKVTNGKITSITNGIDSSGYKIDIGKAYFKIMQSYNNKIMDLIAGFGLNTENFSLTVSSSIYSVMILSFTFYYENTNTIKYEIEIKIEIVLKAVLEKVLALAESFELTPVIQGIGLGAVLYIIFLIISNLFAPGVSAGLEALSTFLLSFLSQTQYALQ